jgi:hypothetical protein
MLREILFTLEGATDWTLWLRMEGMLKQVRALSLDCDSMGPNREKFCGWVALAV